MVHEHEFCGRIHKSIPLTPIVWDGQFITAVENQGDDFVCKGHALQLGWCEAFRDDADEKAGIGTEAEFIADGYEIFRDEHCTLPWDESNPCYAVGAMLFIDEDHS